MTARQAVDERLTAEQRARLETLASDPADGLALAGYLAGLEAGLCEGGLDPTTVRAGLEALLAELIGGAPPA